MNYEEKYKEALQAVNELKQINQSDDGIQKWADKYFPELKDSEDESIRKMCMKYLDREYQHCSFVDDRKNVEKCIVWLEKQGEQKPVPDWMPKFLDQLRSKKNYFDWHEQKDIEGGILAIINWMNPNYFNKKDGKQKADKVEPKFKVGDYLVNDYCKGKVIKLTDDAYLLDTGQGIPFSYEHNAHLWTIQDAKDGDLVYVSTGKKGIQAIFYRFDSGIIYFHCYLCTDFTQGGYLQIGDVELVYPLQKTHYKRFFGKMHEAGYEWDAEKKELKKIEQSKLTAFEEEVKDMINDYRDAIGENDVTTEEVKKHAAYLLSLIPQKSAWSEEDKNRLNHVIKIIDFNIENGDYYYGYNGRDYLSKNEIVNWLKSLKDRYTWKPSEEQMKSLSLATQCVYAEEDIKNLESLYTDLKKI